jgi:hypothetical protein
MLVKVQMMDGTEKKIPVTEFRERRARAFSFGTMNGVPAGFQFTFEHQEYQRGVDQDDQIRKEIAEGLT